MISLQFHLEFFDVLFQILLTLSIHLMLADRNHFMSAGSDEDWEKVLSHGKEK